MPSTRLCEHIQISFLTKPLASWERFTKDCERRFNYFKYTLRGDAYKAWTCTFPLGGHQDLVDSFIKGAASFEEVDLLINPSKQELNNTIVYIPGSWRALRDTLPMRRAGIIKKLIAGPLICFQTVDEHDGIIGDASIDCYIVASEWVKREYTAEAAKYGLNIRNIQVCPAGVDQCIWAPLNLKEDKTICSRVMLYVKGEGNKVSADTLNSLAQSGFDVRVLKAGSHVPTDYKNMLEWCDFAVILGGSETQGLALTQAWSMNRPTLVYESESVIARGRDAAPYITPQTGMKWHDVEELREGLAALRNCTPRRWVLENQTNEAAFRQFLSIVKTL